MTSSYLSLLALVALAQPAGAARTIEVSDWILPYEGPKEFEANVGDTIVFDWTRKHDVYIHPSMSCDLEGRILVGTDPGSSHTFAEDEGSPGGTEHFFSCDVGKGAHCQAGQSLIVTVFSDSQPDSEPDSAESSSGGHAGLAASAAGAFGACVALALA